MSVRQRIRYRGGSDRFSRVRRTATEVCFGDSVGVTLFLAFLCWFVLTWRFGAFFNDVGLFVPALERLAAGHLSLGSATSIEQLYPGMYYRDGQVYARNYGQLALSLPAYWFVTGIGGVAFRALLVVGWSAMLVVVTGRIASHCGRRRLGTVVGATVGILAVIANGLTFKPLAETQLTIVALQVTSLLAGAFVGVLMYRILSRQYGRRIGVLAGALTVFASPVGFWATIPKRHTFAALFVVLALFALVRSRDVGDSDRLGQAGFRAIAYASAGILAWIHAPEGFTLFLAVAVVDLPTGPRNDRRTLAIIAGALVLSLVPFFLTNYIVAGNPLEPPRFLRTFRGVDRLPGSEQAALEGGSMDGGVETSGTDGGSDPNGAGTDGRGSESTGDSGSAERVGESTGFPFAIDLEAFVPAAFLALLRRGFELYFSGIALALGDFDRLVTVFGRWGRLGYDPGNLFFGDGTNLSVLESLPVAAALVVAPVHYGRRVLRERGSRFDVGVEVADWFVLLFSLLLVALYLDRLPSRVMVTVRYLHPLYPLLVYAIFRNDPVRTLLTTNARPAFAGYGLGSVFGSVLVVAWLLAVDATKGDVFQAFAVAALLAATTLVLTSIAGRFDSRVDRLTAVSFGVAAGTTTAFILVTSLVVLHYGPSALPVVESLSGDIRWAVLT